MNILNSKKQCTQHFIGGEMVIYNPHYNRQKAFTLAEIIIVLTVLGIVAMITVPSLIKRQQEVTKRTKIKRAIADYDKVVQNIVIENDLHSDTELAQWADSKDKNSCANTSSYFKVADGNGCVFKTGDGVWWDIDNILKPIIALKQSDLSNLDNDTTFQLVTSYDSNAKAFRTNDMSYESTGENKDAIKKLFSFVNNEEDTSTDENEDNLSTVDAMDQYLNDNITFENMINQLYPDKKICVGSDRTNCIYVFDDAGYGGNCALNLANANNKLQSFLSDMLACPAYAEPVNCSLTIYENGNAKAQYELRGSKWTLEKYTEINDDGTTTEHNCNTCSSEECHKYSNYSWSTVTSGCSN